MFKYLPLALTTFLLWCLTTLTQNASRNLSEMGYTKHAESLLVPMWLFMASFTVSLVTLLIVALRDLRKLSN